MSKKILISIPAKNESEHIENVIISSLEQIEKNTGSVPTILVIDDGSTDNTSTISKDCGATVITHKESRGLGQIFSEAVHFALNSEFDIMLTIDADGQFDPNDIGALIKPILNNEADFVTGSRFTNGSIVNGIPKIKHIGNHAMAKLISSILGKKYSDVSCGFRAYSKEALLNINTFGAFTYTQEVFLNLGVKNIHIKEIPINVKYFKNRQSRIANNIIHYAFQTSKIILKSVIQYKPMRLFGFISIILMIIGLPILLWLSIRYIITDLISPFKGIAIISMIFVILSFASMIVGTILDIISRLQITMERTLYYARKKH